MRAPKTAVVLTALGLGVSLGPIDGPTTVSGQSKVELAVQPAAMGDYEVVLNWPRPLPDTDLPHAGWTWGSGAGVFAESPDKVWVAQRSEIQLPPGATPWICPCLLTPRRTNTGRRAYSGKDYPLRAAPAPPGVRRRSQRHDHRGVAAARPHAGAAARFRAWRGRTWPAQGAHQSVRSREAPLDRRRRPAHHQHLHQRREAGAHDGRARRARPRRRTTSTAPPTSPGCPTAPSSWPTATPAPAWPSSIATGSS